MSIITLPTDLFVGEFGIEQLRYDTMDVSDETGSADTRLKGPPRWKASLGSGDDITQAQAAKWKSLGLKLRGGINHLALYDLNNPRPRGTARRTGALLAGATAGATELVVGGISSSNLLRYGSFESDANGDGVADGWEVGTGSIGRTHLIQRFGSQSHGAVGQYVEITAVGTPYDTYILYSSVLAVEAGKTYKVKADFRTNYSSANILVRFFDASNAILLDASSGGVGIASYTTQRMVEFTCVAPPTATQAQLMFRGITDTGHYMMVDRAQFGLASEIADFAYPYLLEGDWMQLGTGVGSSQLVMVTDDVTFNDSGAANVKFEPPTRILFAGGTPVNLEKPVAYYKRVGSDSYGWHAKAGSLLEGGFMMNDLVEQWS